MTINECIENYKSCYTTNIDFQYISTLSYYVFGSTTSPKIATVKSDISFILQISSNLFNYFNQKSYEEQMIWYDALETGCNTTIRDSNTLIDIINGIPSPDSHAQDFIVVLNILIADCNAIIETIIINRTIMIEKIKVLEETITEKQVIE